VPSTHSLTQTTHSDISHSLSLTHPSLPPSPPPAAVVSQHVGEEELLWSGSVTGEFSTSFEYRYAVVDEDMNVVKWRGPTDTAHNASSTRT
jgi:hypothetical protein